MTALTTLTRAQIKVFLRGWSGHEDQTVVMCVPAGF